jgi:hypothetical protein
MDFNVDLTEKKNETIGTKHWLYQVIPPVLMLCILFTTDKGASLVFIAGIFVLPVLVSFISIIVKLIFFKKRKYYLVRPILTIAMFIQIIIIANWAYDVAREQAIEEAKIIQQQCNENLVCPNNPDGWIVDDSRLRKNDLGHWLKYTATYYYKPDSFNIRVYKGPDLGDNITGGVHIPFKVEAYVDG